MWFSSFNSLFRNDLSKYAFEAVKQGVSEIEIDTLQAKQGGTN